MAFAITRIAMHIAKMYPALAPAFCDFLSYISILWLRLRTSITPATTAEATTKRFGSILESFSIAKATTNTPTASEIIDEALTNFFIFLNSSLSSCFVTRTNNAKIPTTIPIANKVPFKSYFKSIVNAINAPIIIATDSAINFIFFVLK